MTSKSLAKFFNAEDDDDNLLLPPRRAVDDQKVAGYVQGNLRKSRRDKEKEAAEQKKRDDDAEAQHLMAEFLDSFEDDSRRDTSSNTFVPSGARTSQPFKKAPPPRPSSARRSEPSPAAPLKPRGGKRAMDSFLEEIKRDQAAREERYHNQSVSQGRSVTALAAYESQSGSHHRGDTETSNVFASNLPTHINDSVLGNYFARFGPVASVKIMWPRMEGGDSRRNVLSGFVSFMTRRDAEDAVAQMDGAEWLGSTLRVGWGKAVPVPARPLYVAQGSGLHASRGRSPSPLHDGYRFRRRRDPRYDSCSRSRSRSRSRDRRYRSRSRSPDARSYRRRSRSPRRRDRRSWSRSRSSERRHEDDPIDSETESFIRMVAIRVKESGPEFEKALREREEANDQFKFLRQQKSRAHHLYRDMLASSASLGDTFDDDGSNSAYSTDSAEESERERVRKDRLGKLARRRFQTMLRGLSGHRGETARCMSFSLEHAEAAADVADMIIASLLVDSTAVPRKVARLHLICDILHNAAVGVSHAWTFRQVFQARLGIVFDHFSSIRASFPGRMTAQAFRGQILTVVEVWEAWIVFPPEFTTELRRRLDGGTVETKTTATDSTMTSTAQNASDTADKPTKFKTSSFQPAVADGDDLDGAPMDSLDGEPIEDMDGQLMDDLDGAPIEDVDGDPLVYFDGEPPSDAEAEDIATTGVDRAKAGRQQGRDDDEVSMEQDSDDGR